MTLYCLDDSTLLLAEEIGEQADPLRVKLGVTAVVRYWGVTRGRGQLATEGPTEKTIVDPEPSGGLINWIHVRRTIPVTPAARAKWLRKLASLSQS